MDQIKLSREAEQRVIRVVDAINNLPPKQRGNVISALLGMVTKAIEFTSGGSLQQANERALDMAERFIQQQTTVR